MEGDADEVPIWDECRCTNGGTLPSVCLCSGFQDAMHFALQSVLQLQEISCTKDEEEGVQPEAPGNAPYPCDDFVSYLSS